MAGEDDDIVVTIENEPDTGNDGNTTVVLEDTTQRPAKKAAPDDPIETLKAQLAERNQALETANQRIASAETTASQATQRAATAERVATEARTQVAQSTRTTIESGIAAAKAEADAAEEAYKTAFEAGNAGDMAKAQRRMARAEADLSQLESAKADLPTVEKRPPAQQQQPTQPVDQTEAFISQHTPRTQSWMRAHMDYVTDAKKNAKMVAGHWSAVSEGIAPDTDQYFEHVEKFVGLKPNGKAAEPKPEPPREPNGQFTSQRRPTAPVAPVTPTGGGVEGGARRITLTPGEAAAATDGVTHVWNYDDPSGKGRFKKGEAIGLVEMAKRKEALMKAGRYHGGNVDGT